MKNYLSQLGNAFVNLCFLRGSPAALPFSPILLMIILVIATLLDLISLSQISEGLWVELLIPILLNLAITIGAIYFLLARKQYQERLNKVLVAWFGTELLLSLVLKAILILLPLNVSREVPQFMGLIFLIWNVAIKAQILKVSLEIKMGKAVLITLGILIVSAIPIILSDALLKTQS